MKKYVCYLLSLFLILSMVSGCQSASIHSQQTETEDLQPISTAPVLTTTISDEQIRLQPQMSVIELSKQFYCSYFVSQDVYEPGDTITVNVMVKTVGGSCVYTGAIENQFSNAQLVCDGGAETFVITPIKKYVEDDGKQRTLPYMGSAEHTVAFVIPDDAPAGNYILEMSIFGAQVRFDLASAVEEKQLKVLTDLPEETQAMINPDYGQDYYVLYADSYHIYGEFGDVFVFYRYGFASMGSSYEIVNDMCFNYSSGLQLRVYTPDGNFTMSDAFDKGLLTAEQVHEVFYNLLYARSMDYNW